MSQAHKTPGNKVILKPSLFADASWSKYYEQYKHTIFEVQDGHGFTPKDVHHMTIKSLSTGEIIGIDPEWIQTYRIKGE